MVADYNPSFEDAYPSNRRALFNDFRDALVIFVDRIDNLLDNSLSKSAFYELARAHQNLLGLGMPNKDVMTPHQRRAWKKLLMQLDKYDFIRFIMKPGEANSSGNVASNSSIDSLFTTGIRLDDSSHILKEEESRIKSDLENMLMELKTYKEFLAGRGRTGRTGSNHESHPRTKDSGKPTNSKKLEKKFKPWTSSGDACFILDGQRILFHWRGKQKDLCLRNDSKTQKLLIILNEGVMQSADIKEELCSPGTKPTKIVLRANESLNKKILEKGFTDLPDNILFVQHNDKFGHYKLTVPLHTKEQFDRLQ